MYYTSFLKGIRRGLEDIERVKTKLANIKLKSINIGLIK